LEAALIKLLAIDIDGTLLDSRGRVPQANLDAIRRAAACGVRPVIATGRSFHFALQAIAELPEPLTLIVHNGAVARSRSGETLLRRLLPQAVAMDVLAATLPWRGDATCVFDRPAAGQLVYDQMDWTHPNRAGFRARNLAIIEAVARLEDAITEDPVQIAFNGGLDAMRAIAAHLAASAVAPQLAILMTEYPRRDFAMVDVCAAGITKGSGVAAIAAMLGIDRTEVMAVGDNHNDRAMLEWAGVGVVMGNAEAAMKDAQFHLTGTNDDAGLAQAIDRFILPPAARPNLRVT
jgi:Cof subfamily protein (haloacid dehalogenase superfamily)